MDIIPKSAPTIDPQRVDESLEEFRNYMVEVLELIDFTLSNQKTRVMGAVSEDNFKELASAVQALDSKVTSQGSELSAISRNLQGVAQLVGEQGETLSSVQSNLEQQARTIETLEQSVQGTQQRLDALEQQTEQNTQAISGHEQRISALESAEA